MAKYKIQQYVTISFQKGVHVLQIFGIREITRPAGTQVFYSGRVNGVTEEGVLYHGPEELLVREEEITGTAVLQEHVWDEAARIRAEKNK